MISSNAQIKNKNCTIRTVKIRWLAFASLGLMVLFILGGEAQASTSITTTASYYTVSSCLAESGQCTMANGDILKDEGEYTFAHPTLAFGQKLRIKCGNREIVARCTDRGPNTKCLRKGIGIDLNLSAFKALVGEDVSCGLVKVSLTLGE